MGLIYSLVSKEIEISFDSYVMNVWGITLSFQVKHGPQQYT